MELIEIILLNLPVKSLCRFSTVSKSWNKMIHRREFLEAYRGREMIVLRASYPEEKSVVVPLSSLSSDNPIDKATPFIRPFTTDNNYVAASHGGPWCVEFENSLLLYNPSISKYRKLPTPPSSARVPIGSKMEGWLISVYAYGLGVDGDGDYKMIKIHRTGRVETEMYSRRSDSWTSVESPPRRVTFSSLEGRFASGAVHWLVLGLIAGKSCCSILSFDFSKGKFTTLKLPKMPRRVVRSDRYNLGLSVFGEKLRVWRNYATSFAVWVMDDDYGYGWTKELEIDYGHITPLRFGYVKPFYFTDSFGNLIKAVIGSNDMQKIFLCKQDEQEEDNNKQTLVDKSFGTTGCCSMFDTYVESFVSP